MRIVLSLQTGAGFTYVVKTQLGARVPSTQLVAPIVSTSSPR